jgi:predicted NBD/HSP70 family sugar kinase
MVICVQAEKEDVCSPMRGEQTFLKKYSTSDRRRISGEEVAKAALEGDRVAIEVLETAGKYFGLGLAVITQIINPELIVVGGGLTNIGDLLLKPTYQGYYEFIQPELTEAV